MKDKTQARLASLVQTREKLVQLRTVLKNKINNMAAAQGINFRKPDRGGAGIDIAASLILEKMPPLTEDRWFKPEIEKVHELLSAGDFIEEVEKALGTALLP